MAACHLSGRINPPVAWLQVSFLLALPETNPNISYSNGNTPLIIAVQENHTDIVLMLLSRPDIKVPQS